MFASVNMAKAGVRAAQQRLHGYGDAAHLHRGAVRNGRLSVGSFGLHDPARQRQWSGCQRIGYSEQDLHRLSERGDESIRAERECDFGLAANDGVDWTGWGTVGNGNAKCKVKNAK